MRSYPVKENPIGSAVNEILRYKQRDRQTDIVLLYFKDWLCFQVRLEEDFVLQLPFLLPEDNYSCDIIRGVPAGLFEFLAPLQVM